MTTIDIDAIRPTVLAAEPANNSFVVWYDPNREPYAVYFRSDANAWDGGQRWFNADQAGNDLDGPYCWDNLREEMRGNDGPYPLVSAADHAAKVAELTAERDAARELLDALRGYIGEHGDGEVDVYSLRELLAGRPTLEHPQGVAR